MIDLKRVKSILETAELKDEHFKALEDFFTQYTEEVRKSERKKLGNDGEMISKALAEKAFDKFREDSEEAFNLFKEDSKNAFELFKEDSEKAFELYEKDLQTEYTENMIKGLQDLYTDIEERVKKDFMESKDVSILENIKKLMIPLIATDDKKELVEEIERLKNEKQEIISENENISKENVINSLVSGFPKEYSEEIKTYLEKAKNEDEIYERFSFICEMVDKGALKPEEKKDAINEEITKEEISSKKKKKPEANKKKKNVEKTSSIKDKKVITEEMNTGTVKSKSVDKNDFKYFTDEDDALISMLFSN